MDLAALKMESNGTSSGVWWLSEAWQEDRRMWSVSFHYRKKKKSYFSTLLDSFECDGITTHQVHIQNRSLIMIYIHRALLWSEADGTVLQGEGGAGCSIISETGPNMKVRRLQGFNVGAWSHSVKKHERETRPQRWKPVKEGLKRRSYSQKRFTMRWWDLKTVSKPHSQTVQNRLQEKIPDRRVK